jgi:hypothetical protein
MPLYTFALLALLQPGATFKSPDTIAAMMVDVAKGITAAKENNVALVLVDVPLPVTGGTELDDWPGGDRSAHLHRFDF